MFLRPIKDTCVNTAPRWFMFDNPEQYFNACVFRGKYTCKVICVWYVHRAWRKEHGEKL